MSFREVNGRAEMEFLSSRYRYAVDQGTGRDFSLTPELISRIRSPAAISPAGMLHWWLHTRVGTGEDSVARRDRRCAEKRKAMSRLGFDPGHLLSSEHTSSLYDTCLLALLLAPDRPFPWYPLPYCHPYPLCRHCYSTSQRCNMLVKSIRCRCFRHVRSYGEILGYEWFPVSFFPQVVLW